MAFKMKGSPYAKGTHKTTATMAYFKGSALKQKSEKFKEAGDALKQSIKESTTEGIKQGLKTEIKEPGPKLPTKGNIDIPKKALTKVALTGATKGMSQLIMPDVNLKKAGDAFKETIDQSTTEGIKQKLKMSKKKGLKGMSQLTMPDKKGLIDKKDISKTYSDAGEPGVLRPKKSGAKKLGSPAKQTDKAERLREKRRKVEYKAMAPETSDRKFNRLMDKAERLTKRARKAGGLTKTGSPAKNYKNPRDYKVFNMGNEAAPPFKQHEDMTRVLARKASSTFSSKPKKRLFGGTKTVTTTTDDTGAKTKTKTIRTKKGDMKKRKTISATETIKEKFGRKGSLRAHLEGATDRELTKGKIRVTHGEGKGAKHKMGSVYEKRERKKQEREDNKLTRKSEGSKLRQKLTKKKKPSRGKKFLKETMPFTHELGYIKK